MIKTSKNNTWLFSVVLTFFVATAMFFALLLFSVTAYGEETYYSPAKLAITSSVLNVRKGPGTDYEIVTTLPQGYSVYVYAKEEDKVGVYWYKTTYGGQWAYVAADYVQVSGSADSGTITPVNPQIKESYYNPYKKGKVNNYTPVTSAPIQGTSVSGYFESGRDITVYSIVNNGNTDFYKTTYAGKWVYLPITTVNLDKPVETNYSPLKSGKVGTTTYVYDGIEGSYVTTLTVGTPINIYSIIQYEGNSWYKTTYAGKWIYIATNTVAIDKPVETNYSPLKNGKVGTTTYVYDGIEGSYVTTLTVGTPINIYSIIQYEGNSWYKTTYAGKWIYIATNTVAIDKPVETNYSPLKNGKVGTTTYVYDGIEGSYVTTLTVGTPINIYSIIQYEGNSWYKTTYAGKWIYIAANTVNMSSLLDGKIISYNNSIISSIGAQPYSGPCGIYAMAYVRAVLDGSFGAGAYSSVQERIIAEYGKGTSMAYWYVAGGSSTYYTSARSCYMKAIDEINNGRPCIVSMNNGYTGNNHYVTLIGYTKGTTESNVALSSFIAIDPAYGVVKYLSTMKYYDSGSPQLITFN